MKTLRLMLAVWLVLMAISSPIALADPLCPSTSSDIVSLNPWTACVVTIMLTKTQDEINAFISSGAIEQCIAEKNSCAAATKFDQCQNTTQDLMLYIVPESLQTATLLQCPNFFKGFVEYCPRPFGELTSLYCPPPPLLPIPAIGGIVGGGVFMIALITYVCIRTKRSIMLDREIEAAVTFGGASAIPFAKDSQVMQASNPSVALPPANKKSIYHGVVWNYSANGWDAIYETPTVREWLGTFLDEEKAARKYDARLMQLQKAGINGMPLNFPDEADDGPATVDAAPSKAASPPRAAATAQVSNVSIAPPPGLGYSMQLTSSKNYDPNREKHIQDLIQFYHFHDPDRPDIEAHVIALFDKYNFRGIARALLRKYGVLPSGWEFEYDATRSIAMSMAARLFNGPSGSAQSGVLPPSQAIAIQKDPMPDF